MKIIWVTLLLLVPQLFATQDIDEEFTHENVWKDPNDPTSGESPPASKRLLSVRNQVQKPDQSLRLILRQLLHETKIDYHLEGSIKKDVQIKISRHSMSVLSKYLKNDEADLAEEREAVRSALSNIFSVKPPAPDRTWQDTFVTLQPFIFTLNIFILPAAAFVVLRSIVRPRNFWILVLSTALLVSMYSGYSKKYQEAESRRFAQFQEHAHDSCATEGLLSRMVEILASPFQYRQKSKCLKYIESQTISIFHEISIIEVFSETISGGFFAFFSGSAKHFNLFFRNLYDGAPLIAQIVMTIFLVLMLGAIRTPFFSYEPIWLNFCSSSIGKIAGWLDGEPPQQPAPQLLITAKEMKRLEQARNKKPEMISYPTSEREDVVSGSENGNEKKSDNEREESMKMEEDSAPVESSLEDDLSLLGESSEDEDEEKVNESPAKIDSTTLSESSF
ncbi:Chloride channel CLIC-like protein 1 [Caenorhabditis elegans]|uniref:Chloride channel CLIC-like protein 1 n=1 Tax=Caenorhabditis elegans TaxID=6239 RepID=Q8I132_CAEEL|nr:Chloride channel CLIC-like protein 1 [Caenorhabditis elegans]CAD59139.1 Chloride channel CLIC-like protein 1 [Caenorhabditis elegans]|eukprot:NP_871910.1 Uncharacterized protein CELE_B0334.11 [Caenorhabditis elegans]